jgi:hypothetical protein
MQQAETRAKRRIDGNSEELNGRLLTE